MATHNTLTALFDDIADAIREKTGDTAAIVADDFPAEVRAIVTGVETTIVVTTKAGATVTATNGGTTVSGTADSSGACSLNVKKAGTWAVTAELSGESVGPVRVVVENEYIVKIPFISTILNENDWTTISEVSSAEEGENYWAIGDRKEVILNGTVGGLSLSNYSCYAFIIGFNHNSGKEGTGRIHFQLAKTALSGGADICFADNQYGGTGTSSAFRINMTSSNTGGWEDSYMRKVICGTSKTNYTGTVLSVIPEELRNAIKSVTKYTNNEGNTQSQSSITNTTDFFFLLAETEVFGSVVEGNVYEQEYQEQYQYYRAGNSKIKKKQNNIETSALWWLRSPRSSRYDQFLCVSAGGNIDWNPSDTSQGFSPCFCV